MWLLLLLLSNARWWLIGNCGVAQVACGGRFESTHLSESVLVVVVFVFFFFFVVVGGRREGVRRRVQTRSHVRVGVSAAFVVEPIWRWFDGREWRLGLSECARWGCVASKTCEANQQSVVVVVVVVEIARARHSMIFILQIHAAIWIIFCWLFCLDFVLRFFLFCSFSTKTQLLFFRSIFLHCFLSVAMGLIWALNNSNWLNVWLNHIQFNSMQSNHALLYPINLMNTHFSWPWQQQVDMFAHDREIKVLLKLIFY